MPHINTLKGAIFCLLLCLTGHAFAQDKLMRYTFAERTAVKVGDAQSWKEMAFDDSQWVRLDEQGLPASQSLFWVRNHYVIRNSDTLQPYQHAVKIGILGAYEVYWDGVFIGRSGQPAATRSAEEPGLIEAVFRIPADLYRPGKHVLSLRVSSFYSQAKLRQRYYHAVIGPYEEFLTDAYLINIPSLMMQGAFLLVGVYFLLLFFFYQHQWPVLTFSLLCFSMALLIFVESYRDLFNYGYPWHWLRLSSVLGISILISNLLALYCLLLFRQAKLYWLLLLLIASTCAIGLLNSGFDIRSYYIFAVGLLTSLLLSAFAKAQQREGASLMLAGLLMTAALMLLFPSRFMDNYLFVSFAVLALAIFTTLVLHLRSQRLEKQEIELNSARLEIELLKKQLQPHFVMNTLTAIQEWIEDSPKDAVKFIDALAEEFRILSSFSSKQLVPLAEELALCQSHLAIMSYRRNREFQLQSDCDGSVLVPPAVFHTLLENALTHNKYNQGQVQFQFRQVGTKESNRFIFSAPLGEQEQKQAKGSGTGLLYIKARLEESFPGVWKLYESQDSDYWHTEIVLPSQFKRGE